jgi:hypothetical protein
MSASRLTAFIVSSIASIDTFEALKAASVGVILVLAAGISATTGSTGSTGSAPKINVFIALQIFLKKFRIYVYIAHL